jgi:hypothetical protein
MAKAKTPDTVGSRSKTLTLKQIRLDGDTQSRIELNDAVVKEYHDLAKDGHEFPPLSVTFDGSDYWLWDGFHRRFAYVKAGVEKAKCIVIDGTREDARWLSYGANKDHGLPRTNPDKQRAVVAALKHPNGAKLSDGQIAEHVGVSQPMVGKYRSQLAATQKDFESTERTGRDGRTINTENIGKRGDAIPNAELWTADQERKARREFDEAPRKDPPSRTERIPVPEYDDEPEEIETIHSYYSEFLDLWHRADEPARAMIRIFVEEQA